MIARRRGDTAANRRRGGAWWRSKLASHAPFLVVSLVCVTALMMLRLADPLVVRNARETAFDLMQRLSPRIYLDAPVRIVDIDEGSLERLGQWPWPRDMLAELVDRLHAAGAGAVVFDFIFAEPDRLSPSRLIESPLLQSIRGAEGG